jgi:hypothetical protein
VIRGVGPGLARFGIGDAIADPRLTVFDASGQTVASGDDWSTQAASPGRLTVVLRVDDSTITRVGAFSLETGSKDAALQLRGLRPGNYTVQLTGGAGQTGNGLIEVYEDDNRAERITNLSSRVFVSPQAVAVAGISVRGGVAKRILVRAVGPTLASFGVASPLPDPRLELRDAVGVVAANDDWESQSNAVDIRAAANRVGAFALGSGTKDAVILATLPPGNYTAVIESVQGGSGVALLELFEVE